MTSSMMMKQMEEQEEERKVMSFLKSLPLRFQFRPTEEELLDHINKKLENSPLPANQMEDVNVNDQKSWELTEKHTSYRENEYYYLRRSERKHVEGYRLERKAGIPGYWKFCGARIIHDSNGVEIGLKKVHVFYQGKIPIGDKTAWVMTEYKAKVENAEGTTAKVGGVVSTSSNAEGTTAKVGSAVSTSANAEGTTAKVGSAVSRSAKAEGTTAKVRGAFSRSANAEGTTAKVRGAASRSAKAEKNTAKVRGAVSRSAKAEKNTTKVRGAVSRSANAEGTTARVGGAVSGSANAEGAIAKVRGAVRSANEGDNQLDEWILCKIYKRLEEDPIPRAIHRNPGTDTYFHQDGIYNWRGNEIVGKIFKRAEEEPLFPSTVEAALVAAAPAPAMNHSTIEEALDFVTREGNKVIYRYPPTGSYFDQDSIYFWRSNKVVAKIFKRAEEESPAAAPEAAPAPPAPAPAAAAAAAAAAPAAAAAAATTENMKEAAAAPTENMKEAPTENMKEAAAAPTENRKEAMFDIEEFLLFPQGIDLSELLDILSSSSSSRSSKRARTDAGNQ